MKLSVAILIFSLCTLSSFKGKKPSSSTLIFCNSGCDLTVGDTTYIPYITYYRDINRIIKKQVNDSFSAVSTILIAQPSQIIKQINFKPFIKLKTIIFAGNDFDYIDSSSCAFLKNKNLKKIISSSVFLTLNGEDEELTTEEKYNKFEKFIHATRPDIKLEIAKFGKYNKEGWGD